MTKNQGQGKYIWKALCSFTSNVKQDHPECADLRQRESHPCPESGVRMISNI